MWSTQEEEEEEKRSKIETNLCLFRFHCYWHILKNNNEMRNNGKKKLSVKTFPAKHFTDE